ncbi:Uncharacterised protein [Mycobacterium tuberculosis]|nr:Uncharacterised protein [Mycobacterium tuberculosis]
MAALRAVKKESCAALKRRHRASSTSLLARPAAFQSASSLRNSALVAVQSVDSDNSSARSQSRSLLCRTPDRSRSNSAKWDPRRRLNVSRAVE